MNQEKTECCVKLPGCQWRSLVFKMKKMLFKSKAIKVREVNLVAYPKIDKSIQRLKDHNDKIIA